MSGRVASHVIGFAVGAAMLTVLASCATSGGTSPPPAPAGASMQREWESWPPPDSVKSAPAPDGDGAPLHLLPKDGGWKIDELFQMIHKTTGVSIIYDGGNATYKQAKIEFVGEHVIPESQLFAWLQAVLSYRKLVLVPVGPKGPGGRQQWFVMDEADPALKSRPTFLDESEVFAYAERDGLYVVASLRVRDTVDVTRVRNMLSAMSTQTAGIGRISDDGARHLIVADFAPVVAAMKHLLDRVNADTPPSAVRPPATPKTEK